MDSHYPVIFGHQRSGNHWCAALIAKNIFKQDAYAHMLNPNHNLKPVADKVVYVTRNIGDVMRSMFAMRDRFGLAVDDYREFLKTPYNKMYRPGGCNVMVDTLVAQRVETHSSGSFANIAMTPPAWWANHNLRLNCGLVVAYERLLNNLHVELERIAEYLGRKLISWEPIERRVGWYPIGRHE